MSQCVIVVEPDEYDSFVTEVVGPFDGLDAARARLRAAGWIEDSWRPEGQPDYRATWRKNPKVDHTGCLAGDYRANIHDLDELP